MANDGARELKSKRRRGARKKNIAHRKGGAVELAPHDIELSANEIKAVQLRSSGLSFHEIAQALGYSNRSGAYKAVKRALDKWGWQTVDDYRKQELIRLDQMQSRVWTLALGQPERRDEHGNVLQPRIPPDTDAMRTLMQIMERRSRLLGLDAPTQLDIGIAPEEDKGRQVVEDYEAYAEVIQDIFDEVEDDDDYDAEEDEDEEVYDAEIVDEEESA